ncbi:MAG: apolipoprotein N-acyltransferase [Holosporaceae bacterium]|jgi:apolipoprotein N-acyltransferase|nr:apolipoprotein N-acyltransferase [Holosporaceae bacterium]
MQRPISKGRIVAENHQRNGILCSGGGWRFSASSSPFQCLVHFSLGAFGALGFAPFDLCFPFLLSFGWLFAKIVAKETTPSATVGRSFLFFLGLYVANLYWLAYPLTLDLASRWILIPFALIVIPALLSLFALPAVFIGKKYCDGIPEAALAFSSMFCIAIYFHGHYLPGFPWVLPGYIWSFHEIFLQTLGVWGIYGLSFVTVLLSCIGGGAYVHLKRLDLKNAGRFAAVATGILLFLAIFGFFRLRCYETTFLDRRVRLVQCSLNHDEKANRLLSFRNLQRHIACSRHSAKLDFIIWPEAAIPYLYHEKFSQLHDFLKSPLKIGEHLIAGAVRRNLTTEEVYNSAIIVNHLGQNVRKYDKRRLVAFGEYIPLRNYIPFQSLRSIAGDVGDFQVGRLPQLIEVDGLRMLMAICYEAAFPGEMNEKPADLIVNLTNDGWFGSTSEPFQHLQIVRARAVEMGLPLIRATNCGVSAVFDPCGREIGRISFGKSGFLECRIPKTIDETPYGKLGDTLFFLMITAALLYSLRRRFGKTLRILEFWKP